jgi:ABC-type microcin C transport system duplicated ATPase subunit YejF
MGDTHVGLRGNDVSRFGSKLDVRDLCYNVRVGNMVKPILKDVCFSLQPGSLCALMGSSGSGKRYDMKNK